ncbi:hypothetical protein PTKU15_28500 [Paraburkholderia terrae]|nr:hypothetical protein PTKU15_28500 [Paraburkholderia terrae]
MTARAPRVPDAGIVPCGTGAQPPPPDMRDADIGSAFALAGWPGFLPLTQAYAGARAKIRDSNLLLDLSRRGPSDNELQQGERV